ncbi:type II CAAX endopeptidase family protein [Rhodococcus sp. HNM0569]|uniref:CPBP family intramembrane glutamic endopeptidase n=1 Tax=Rhodococcus sp. HNM0569 TaxID=2716340 RepID=UPI00146C34FD|nr:type II CAAX endopeptidase family protein [Rhodococcus sp. HNM0569]NLU82132.1 CPBP family intramembrane metalloprotease [Rhodococcus sp. HNM0569]
MSTTPPPTTSPDRSRPTSTATATRLRGIRWFLALTFGCSWIPWVLVRAAGYSLDDPAVQLLTAAFVPALAAIVTRGWITREGFDDAGLRPRIRQSWPSYAIALVLPGGVFVLAAAVAAATGLWNADLHLTRQDVLFAAVALVIPVVAAPIFWGEEFGWTAYLRDRLVPGRPVATTFATGLIWGLWHWPLPWVGYFGGGGTAVDAIVAMLLWLPLSVLLEFVIGWLWARSGSVWPSAIVHGGSNLVVALGLEHLVDSGAHAVTLLMCVAYVPVVACIVVAQWRGRAGAVRTAPAREFASGDGGDGT